MLLYSDPLFLEHKTGAHPERPERLLQVVRQLERTGLDQRCTRPACPAVSLERLERIHRSHYAASVESFCWSGGGRIEVDTVVSPQSYEVALHAAGAVCDAVERVLRGEDRQALCLTRPPGHHALPHSAMGFCLFNHIAIAAKAAAVELGIDRVLIVDWDVHHGNGTQDVFYTDEQVAFLSIHRWPFYPGTGADDETGSGPGLGTTLNLPIEFGTSRRGYLDSFRSALERLADWHRPQLLLISAGFDSHRDDPVGSLGLEIEDFQSLTNFVLDVAETHAKGRVVSVLEGGYNTGILAGCVELHLRTMLERQTGDAASG
jgi:acetoin utilization deacetylase AcuC-like enzyme